MIFIKKTECLCPECLTVVQGWIYEKNGEIFIIKKCSEHGEFTDLYWGSKKQYERALQYKHIGTKLNNPQTKVEKGCPYDCGICPEHKSSTVLGIIDITNRCNLRCPICFAHAGASGYLYEPSKKQIQKMMKNLLSNTPIWTPAIQFSGGEPTVREDLPELVEMALNMGFVHVEVNSNGIRMAESLEYCKSLKRAGVSTIYLQFDGVTPEPYKKTRGFNLLPIKMKAIQNLREAGFFSIVLVPLLIKGVNDNQVGEIIRFAIKNKDVIRAVNFQPISLTGRINKGSRDSMRITIPDLMKLAEEQTGSFIKQEDWYPVSSVQPFCNFLSEVKNEPFVDFAAHPHCGMGTYLIIEEDKITPLTEYLNVDKTFDAFEDASKQIVEGKEMWAKIQLIIGLIKNIKFKVLSEYLRSVIFHSDYLSLNLMHHDMIMIGSMHFMDPYNFDLDRVRSCIIHYATPDGRIIPFCSMNSIHRDEVERKYAKQISTNKITPLYNVEALIKKIKQEDNKYEILDHSEVQQIIRIKNQ
jgi:uncharacterized radical SAM superfamily Fe-S cluster-containing enzyme